MSNMEDYMIDAVARSLKAKHESELSIEEGKWLDWYERTYASDTSEDEEEELFDCPILLKGNEMNEEQQRQCREAFKAENYVITAVDLFGNGDLFDFVNIYRDGFAAGLAAARGEAVVLNVSAWGNDDKTYVSTTKKHPSGDIEVTTSEASPPPQPASEPISEERAEYALNVKHPDCHKAADAFWKYWKENGETHKHGYYESTWGAINQAIRCVGIVEHKYTSPPAQRKES